MDQYMYNQKYLTFKGAPVTSNPNQYWYTNASDSTNWGVTSEFPLHDALMTAASLETGGVFEADGQILFGKYCGQKMDVLPTEYIKAICGATKALRRAMLKELRRRAVCEKLAKS